MKKEISETKDAEKMFVELLRYKRIININMVRVFFVCLMSVSLLGLVPFLRPTVSLTEKRELHKFPKFTFSALIFGANMLIFITNCVILFVSFEKFYSKKG